MRFSSKGFGSWWVVGWWSLCNPGGGGKLPFVKIVISLILKTENPSTMSEFRSISLCTSAYVKYRLISDNALVVIEVFHGMKKKTRGRRGELALKLDMAKAYDRIEWNFLRGVLTNWLLTKEGHKLHRPTLDHVACPDISLIVRDLLRGDGSGWDVERVNGTLCHADAQWCLSIRLNFRSPPDRRVWCPNQDGVFSVHSAYWLGRCNHIEGWQARLSRSSVDAWSLLARIDTLHSLLGVSTVVHLG
ncbi:LOW QUALITY PROTEIN: hypothetical protein V2J09_004672 [Rumex salicifolius]